MKKTLITSLLIAVALLLTSCGHEGMFYGEGTVFSANTQGINYIKGKGVWDFSRENTSLVIESASGDGFVNSGENAFKGHFIVKKTIGKQILGYTVNLAKESPEAVIEWLKSSESPQVEQGSVITIPDAKSKYVAPPAKKEEEETETEEKEESEEK